MCDRPTFIGYDDQGEPTWLGKPPEARPAKRNELFGFPIPAGHFLHMDLVAGKVAFYARWRKIADPKRYLERYWGAQPAPTAAA